MKRLAVLLLTCISVAGQVPDKPKVINFDRADGEHCSVVRIEGRPMLQSVYEGTTVAAGVPMRTAEGDFRVFVLIRQTGPGKTEVKPKRFSALFSNPAHTRFSFYDKAAKVDQARAREKGTELGIAGADSQSVSETQPGASGLGDYRDPQARLQQMRNEHMSQTAKEQEQAGEDQDGKSKSGTTVTPDELYLRGSTLRQGDTAEGFVYFRKPKGSNLSAVSRDGLYEVDLVVNGVVFRFE